MNIAYNNMLIIHDARLPLSIIQTLRNYGTCIAFISENITYLPISGHPDLFFCPIDNKVIVAPNTPPEYIKILEKYAVSMTLGNTFVGFQKQYVSAYNVVVSDHYIIHNSKFTDNVILENKENREFINIKQAFTRCSLLPLKNDIFLTSDRGIVDKLDDYSLKYCYVNPDEIILPGYKNGFIGGCMGVCENRVFICGNLDFYSEGEKIKIFFKSLDYEIIELYQGPLFDGGSLILIDNQQVLL